MRLLEKTIAFLAPDSCLVCQSEGSLLCAGCRTAEIIEPISQCYRCHKLTNDFGTCRECSRYTPLKNVWVAAPYAGIVKELTHLYKFESRRSAVEVMSRMLEGVLPILSDEITVTFVPTNVSRVRGRGFDHASRLAQSAAKMRQWECFPLLRQAKEVHQVGATRMERLKQMDGAFEAQKEYLIKNTNILLIDDVMTTGASLEEAAKTLRRAGAARIYGAVLAH